MANTNDMLSSMMKCIRMGANDDPSLTMKAAHKISTYDGSLESLVSCCKHMRLMDHLLDEYGLAVILDLLPLCYQEKAFDEVSCIIIAHYGHVLIRFDNASMPHSAFIASLDVADLMDEMSSCGLSERNKTSRPAVPYQAVNAIKENLNVILPVIAITAIVLFSMITNQGKS